MFQFMTTSRSNIVALERQQWKIVINDMSPVGHQAVFTRLWKVYANGVAVTLSIQVEEEQFVLYTDLGHARSRTNRTENGRFSTLEAASNRLIQECSGWDRTWDA